jgi:hypothetical protein
MTVARRPVDVNRRVGQTGAEQQHGRAEQHGPEPGRRQRAAECVDETDQQARREAQLRGRVVPLAEHQARLGHADRARGLDGEAAEMHQHRTGRRAGRRHHRAVAHQAEQIERPRSQPRQPQPDRERADAVAPRHGRHRLAALDGGDRREDHRDAGHLARQDIARQHPLAMPTRIAARQGDREHDALIRGPQQLAPHADSSQPHLRPAAESAVTARQQIALAGADKRLIGGRINIEDVAHVLRAAPGRVRLRLPGPPSIHARNRVGEHGHAEQADHAAAGEQAGTGLGWRRADAQLRMRFSQRAAHDKGVVWLFGGAYPAKNGLWSWNGTTWNALKSTTTPEARFSHGLAFDAKRRRLVLRGGMGTGGFVAPNTWQLQLSK